ncbi:MAG: septal ring lytic transglycosylase RlpA family protein [Rhodomicrobiaceae bacterium]
MIKSKVLRLSALTVAAFLVSNASAKASCGTASWYHEGSRTANGERYRPDGITAAHKKLPFGTRVKVTHKRTGRSVVVRINDRGPFIRGRIIDLSRGAKRVLGMGGLAPVCLTILGRGPAKVAEKRSSGKRVAKQQRRERVAAKRQTREVYGTTQTSARPERKNSRRAGRSVKRTQARNTVRRQNQDNRASSFRVAGWPRSGDTTF